ncbi:tetratricopeptide repeat protein [candidate division GN15 bacterium]|nr:tetratricopeptide repeat protein [candidate division GN15 bacterium]
MKKYHLLLPTLFGLLALMLLAVPNSSAQDKPDSVRAMEALNTGIEAGQAGNMDEAVIAYQTAISLNPDLVDAYMNLGAIFFQQQKYDQALQQFRTASEKDPDNADAFANVGRVDYTLRRFPEAIEAFNKAIELNPDDAALYRDLGKAYYQNRDQANAVETLEKCHEMGGGDYLTYLMVGRAYDKLGQDTKAIQALKQSNEMKPNYSAHFALGQIYMGQEKYTQAGQSFQKALTVNSKKFRAAYNYASAMEFADPDNYDQNIANWEAFVRMAKNNPKAKTEVSQAEAHLKELREAKEHAELN